MVRATKQSVCVCNVRIRACQRRSHLPLRNVYKLIIVYTMAANTVHLLPAFGKLRRTKFSRIAINRREIFVFPNFQMVVHGRRRISAFSGSKTFERSNAITQLGDNDIFRRIERFRTNSMRLENDKFVFGTGLARNSKIFATDIAAKCISR